MRKTLFITLLLCLHMVVYAQWSNTTNNFYDSLHMPVTTAAYDQTNPIVVKSEPDGGYFVMWEDKRNIPTPSDAQVDIYTQKFDKSGKQIWTNGGIPVAVSTNPKRFSNMFGPAILSDNYPDYRNFSHACTDGNGGFYIAWQETVRIGSYYHFQVAVQHILANGTKTLADAGYVVAKADDTMTIAFHK